MQQYKNIFLKEYKRLNKAQKEAVNTLQGPVMVIAGPGTGKTQILALRIANILLKTDTNPENILALTFTESGVKAMRERLNKIIGPDAFYININTFHSFSLSLINENPDIFMLNHEAKPIGELRQTQIIQNILERLSKEITELRPFGDPLWYVNLVIQAIKTLKREGITLKKYDRISTNLKKEIEMLEKKEDLKYKERTLLKNLKKQLELNLIYKEYQKELQKEKFYDFEDIINVVNEKLKNNKDFAQKYQEKFQYILVDEFQDTNSAQYLLVKNLTNYWGPNADIFVVGDDEQSIYRFQGASLENILNFKEDFPNTKLITLKNNYRSTQIILDSSRRMIRNNNITLEKHIKVINKKLIAKNKELQNKKIKYGEFSNNITESFYIGTKIKNLIKKGVNPKEVAVLVRYNNDTQDIINVLEYLKVPFKLEGGKNILNSPEVSNFIDILKTIYKIKEHGNSLNFFNFISHPTFEFDYLDNLKIAREASKKRIEIVDLILNNKEFKKLDLKYPKKYLDLVNGLIPKWHKYNKEHLFNRTFQLILEESGYLNYILKQPNYLELLNRINTLYKQVQEWTESQKNFRLQDFIKNLDLMEKFNIPIKEAEFETSSNAVNISTAHKSKGLEFKYVFLYSFTNKKWGNARKRYELELPNILKYAPKEEQNKERNEDERRLFYVALTRAKKQVYLTWSKKYYTPQGQKEGEYSMFFLELPKKNLKKIKVEKLETKTFIKKALKAHLENNSSNKDVIVNKKEEEFLEPIIKDFKLSVTALNTYLTCPYKFKLNNLLRTPRAKTKQLSFGTAIHKALERFFRELIYMEQTPKYKILEQAFLEALEKEPLTETEKEDLRKKGKKVLHKYYITYENDFKTPEYIERWFGKGLGKIYLNDIPLEGKVDRIDLIDKKNRLVKIVDYKTGKPKSRNEIEGNTQNSSGDLKRQLIFYKILCDLDRTFKYKAKKFELDFVEQTSNNKLKKEEYEITKEDVEKLKTLIIKTMRDIKNKKFPKTKEYRNCTNCDYKKHCWPKGIPKLNYKKERLFE